VWQTFRETIARRDQLLYQRPRWLTDEETSLTQVVGTEPVEVKDDIWTDLSRLAEILSDKSSSSLEAETQSEASDPSEKPTAARSGKMSAVGGDIRPFEGLNDGKENIKIFLDDVEFLAECHDGKAPASTKTMLRVFRRFLKGDAYEFWCSLDEEVQTNWDDLKAAFTNKFAVSKSISATQRMNVKNQLLSLKQGPKHISEYIKEAQNLSLRVPNVGWALGGGY